MPTDPSGPRIAVVLFDRLTALDAVGPYDVLSRLPGANVVTVAEQPGPVATEQGTLWLTPQATLDGFQDPDVVVVPGGPGQVGQMQGPLVEWLRVVDRHATWMTSVCTGSLILASAGLLEGRRATSHWLALDQLEQLGARPAQERVVFDEHYVTAAGVSSGIDMALSLADRLAGPAVAQAIQLGIEYDPQPPFDAGSPTTAPREVVALLRARSRFVLDGR